MNATTRAKFVVQEVRNHAENHQLVILQAVTDKPFDAAGKSEDNDFARWTPSGTLDITITNPDLVGKFVAGQKYYLDVIPAE